MITENPDIPFLIYREFAKHFGNGKEMDMVPLTSDGIMWTFLMKLDPKKAGFGGAIAFRNQNTVKDMFVVWAKAPEIIKRPGTPERGIFTVTERVIDANNYEVEVKMYDHKVEPKDMIGLFKFMLAVGRRVEELKAQNKNR